MYKVNNSIPCKSVLCRCRHNSYVVGLPTILSHWSQLLWYDVISRSFFRFLSTVCAKSAMTHLHFYDPSTFCSNMGASTAKNWPMCTYLILVRKEKENHPIYILWSQATFNFFPLFLIQTLISKIRSKFVKSKLSAQSVIERSGCWF